MNTVELAWLAGIMDGEASVGLSNGPIVQLAMTHEPTIARAREIILAHGIDCREYAYRQRNPRHRPDYRIHISGPRNCARLAGMMMPFAVTKHGQWRILFEYGVRRCGKGTRARDHNEIALTHAASMINRRGATPWLA